MTVWFTSPATTPKDRWPSEALGRFVGSTYGDIEDRSKILFLDIGAGSGTNTRKLRDEGFPVISIDSAPEAKADFCTDAAEFCARWQEEFDCIIDINTLCHVERPPYAAIYGALKPGGHFFSIHPALGTEADLSGKGFTRIPDSFEMAELLTAGGFEIFSVKRNSYWHRGFRFLSWQIEASK